eukprot:14590899-Alexandrium_andersonii.AAC.1
MPRLLQNGRPWNRMRAGHGTMSSAGSGQRLFGAQTRRVSALARHLPAASAVLPATTFPLKRVPAALSREVALASGCSVVPWPRMLRVMSQH